MLKETVQEFLDDDAPRLAAALSYYTIFSLPPLLIIVVMISGVFFDPQDIEGEVVGQIGSAIGPEGAEQIRTILQQANRPGSGGPLMTILSIAALLFGATAAFSQLQAALNKAWDVEKDPEKSGIIVLLAKRALSFGMILAIAFLLLVSLVLSALLAKAGGWAAGLLPAAIGDVALRLLDIGLSLVVITALFATMFKVLPDAQITWRDVWGGAFATAALFVLGKFLLGIYFGQADPGSAFGAAGSLALILIWVYYSAMIFFFGTELTQVWARRKGREILPDHDAVRVR